MTNDEANEVIDRAAELAAGGQTCTTAWAEELFDRLNAHKPDFAEAVKRKGGKAKALARWMKLVAIED